MVNKIFLIMYLYKSDTKKRENFVLVLGFRTMLNRLFFSFSVFVLHYNRGSKSRVQNWKFRFRFSYSTRTDLMGV